MSATRYLLLVVLLTACSPAHTAHDADVRCPTTRAAKTAGEAVKTGGTTAWEGLKTAGKTVGGLFSRGSDAARQDWKHGKTRTRSTARAGANDTKAAAHEPCK